MTIPGSEVVCLGPLRHESAVILSNSLVPADVALIKGFCVEHCFLFRPRELLSDLARDLPVHFVFTRALPFWSFGRRLRFVKCIRLLWEVACVGRAPQGRERLDVASCSTSRATLGSGVSGADEQVIEFPHGSQYLLRKTPQSSLVGLVCPWPFLH